MVDSIVKPSSLHVEAHPLNKEFVLASGTSAALNPPISRAGLDACLAVWRRVCSIPAPNWHTLSRCEDNEFVIAELATARSSSDTEASLAAIASEVEHALEHGVRSTTPLACILLATIALECFEGAHDAMALGQAALDLAVKYDHPDYHSIRVIHANLIVSRTAGLNHASRELSNMWDDSALPLSEQLHSISTAFTSGMPLVEVSAHLEKLHGSQYNRQTCEDSRNELLLRSYLLYALRCPEVEPSLEDLGRQQNIYKNQRCGYWLTQLQCSWFAGNYHSAKVASERTAVLLTPFTQPADLLCYHLLSMLTLSRLNSSNASTALELHCVELNRLASTSGVSVSAMVELGFAIADRHARKTLVALCSLDHIYSLADRLGQHWVAAIAAEEAALASSAAGLHSAVGHYRRSAIVSYTQWGALGRVSLLKRHWDNLSEPLAQGNSTEDNLLIDQDKAKEIELSIAHEVNQPLAAIALHSVAAGKWLSRAEPNVERALQSLALISEAARHVGDIVRVIKRFAANEDNEYESVNIDEAIHDALRLLQSTLYNHGIDTELSLDSRGANTLANRVQLQQVVTNLILNAVEALSEVPRSQASRYIKVQSQRFNDHEVDIIVEDNGPGIEPKYRDRIFSRLFSTKAGNSGLGLSISLAIIRALQGYIEFEPREPNGARFRVRLPIQR